MAKQNSVFRKVSLERLSSPEQLNQKLTVVSPVGWLALASLAILIFAAVLWGFMGSISNKIQGGGVLMYGDGIVSLTSQTGGQITDINVQAGEYVERGQVIARVSQEELVRQIEQCKENLAALETLQVETLDFDLDSLNGEIFPEFAQLANQIRAARLQYDAQKDEALKNEQDIANQRAIQSEQAQMLEQQIATLAEQIAEYEELLAYQRKIDLENARAQDNQPAQPSSDAVYTSDRGDRYRRNFRAAQQFTVLDQTGAIYIILSNSTQAEYYPVYYMNGNGIEEYNAVGTYYLPNYYNSALGTVIPDLPAGEAQEGEENNDVDTSDLPDNENGAPGTMISDLPEWVLQYSDFSRYYMQNHYNGAFGPDTPNLPEWRSQVTVYYDTMTGSRYIDLTGNEFQKDAGEADNNPSVYNQVENRPTYDPTLASMQTQLQNYRLQLIQTRLQESQLASGFTSFLWGGYNQTGDQISSIMEQFINLKQIKRQDYQKQLVELQEKYSTSSVITAGFSGTVLGLNIQRYDFVQLGSIVGNIVRTEQPNEISNVLLYVPLDKGKLIHTGMEVGVSPATVNREEHGYIIGEVQSVSLYAVTQEHMMAALQNQQLVQMFGGQSAVIELEIELLRDENTVSGYKWSTPKGAPITIDPGTICSGEIKVSSQRPIDMVIPFIKRLFTGANGGGLQ